MNLYEMWKEYESGLNGVKPARDFTKEERGADATRYCRRKVFWDRVLELIGQGYSSHAAVALIYSTYGEGLSICKILKLLAAEKKARMRG